MFEPDELSGRIRQLRIVWFALLMSIAAFAGVAGFLLRSGGLEIGQTLPRAALTYGEPRLRRHFRLPCSVTPTGR